MNVQSVQPYSTMPIQAPLKQESILTKRKKQTEIGFETNGKQDSFVKTEDGRYIEKTVNPKTGEVTITISKHNWSDTGVLDSKEVTTISSKTPTVGHKQVIDYEHGTINDMLIENPLKGSEYTQSMTTKVRDPRTGKVIKTQYYEMSDVPGIYNVTSVDALGRRNVESSAVKTPEGGIYISKNLTSLDGTKTTYRYAKDSTGNHIATFNKISDRFGNPLSTVDRTYDRVSDTLAYSSVNGRKYTIEKSGKDTIVTDEFLGTKTILNEESFGLSKEDKRWLKSLYRQIGFNPKMSKESPVETLLRVLPGDTLINMSKDINAVVPMADELDSAFIGYLKILNCGTDEFIVNHELGHSMDDRGFQNTATGESGNKGPVRTIDYEAEAAKPLERPGTKENPEVLKEYVFEKGAFIKAFPDFKEEFIDYFIFSPEDNDTRGKGETVAETNAINSLKPIPPEILAMRTHCLQQYFPRTIAAINRITTPIAIHPSVYETVR